MLVVTPWLPACELANALQRARHGASATARAACVLVGAHLGAARLSEGAPARRGQKRVACTLHAFTPITEGLGGWGRGQKGPATGALNARADGFQIMMRDSSFVNTKRHPLVQITKASRLCRL